MLPKIFHSNSNFERKQLIQFALSNMPSIIFFILFLFPVSGFAQEQQQSPVTVLSAQDMLMNIAAQVPNLMRLVTAIAYVLGMYFIFHGILKLKRFGEGRTMMSSEHSLMGPIVFITVGALLIYLPTSVQIGMSTFWTEPNPYGYMQDESNPWMQFISACFLIVQFIGVIAFIRGLVIISHVGGHGGGQQNPFSRGLMHIIGGIFCINIYQFVQVIFATLGITMTF